MLSVLAVAFFLRLGHGFFAVLLEQIRVNLPHFLGLEDGRQILHRHHAV